MIYVAVDKVGIAVLDNVPQGTEDREQWSVCQGSNVARMFLTQERMPRIGWESPQKKTWVFHRQRPSPPNTWDPHTWSWNERVETAGLAFSFAQMTTFCLSCSSLRASFFNFFV